MRVQRTRRYGRITHGGGGQQGGVEEALTATKGETGAGKHRVGQTGLCWVFAVQNGRFIGGGGGCCATRGGGYSAISGLWCSASFSGAHTLHSTFSPFLRSSLPRAWRVSPGREEKYIESLPSLKRYFAFAVNPQIAAPVIVSQCKSSVRSEHLRPYFPALGFTSRPHARCVRA